MALNANHSARSALTTHPVQRDREYFCFHGSGAEYFRIWTINFLLTLVTLGIYSAWAKVRKNRYIYGNTALAGSYFDYLAEPMTILRGRLIALGLLLGLVFLGPTLPLLDIGIFALLGIVTPWLVVRARMFNMRYTAYRNVRFGFEPAYAEAYGALLLWGFLSLLTLGAAAPFAHFRRNSLLINNTRFGNLGFRLGNVAGKFYFAYFLGLVMGALLLMPLVVFLGQQTINDMAAENRQVAIPIILLAVLLAATFYFVAVKFSAALLLRITVNNTTIGEQHDAEDRHKLGADWSITGMLWIYLTNLLILIFSLGLLTPWAQIRILKYQLRHTWIELAGRIDDVVAVQSATVSSIGEEIGDVFDIDIGF